MNTGAAVAGLTGGATAPEKSRCFGFKRKSWIWISFLMLEMNLRLVFEEFASKLLNQNSGSKKERKDAE
jgi:hypothetical protein